MKQKKKETDVREAESKKRVSIAREVTTEMEERKSVFLGHAKPVSTEEEAKAFEPPTFLSMEVTYDESCKMKNYWKRTRNI